MIKTLMSSDHYNIIGLGKLGQNLAKILMSDSSSVSGTYAQNKRLDDSKSMKSVPFSLGNNFPELITKNPTIVTLPPSSSQNLDHWKMLAEQLKEMPLKIYTSSIGALRPEKAHLREIEKVFLESGFIIIRLAGILFYDSHPIKFLTGRELKNSDDPINLIQEKDINLILSTILKGELELNKQVFHLVHPHHPTKKEYYTEIANKKNLDLPTFIAGTSGMKSIDTDFSLPTDFQFTDLY